MIVDSGLHIVRQTLLRRSNETQRLSFSGDTATLTLGLQVTCPEDQPACSNDTSCMPRDDIFGHYTCGSNGDLECLPGFSNPEEFCTGLTPTGPSDIPRSEITTGASDITRPENNNCNSELGFYHGLGVGVAIGVTVMALAVAGVFILAQLVRRRRPKQTHKGMSKLTLKQCTFSVHYFLL